MWLIDSTDTMSTDKFIADKDEIILVTGAAGFIGSRVVENLVQRGFLRIRCFGRSAKAKKVVGQSHIEWMRGNLLSKDDCAEAVKDVSVVIHLAAGRGEKSFPDAYMNTVVTTRNLLDVCVGSARVKRFVNISSFAVYSNRTSDASALLDEDSDLEAQPQIRCEAYTYAKAKQEEIVSEYAERFGLPAVTLRPGVVYGPGNLAISGRVGISPFGVFMHMGGSNVIPLSYVDNCAEAIVLASLTSGIDGEVFNVLDDDLPTSRHFLRLYKQQVRRFTSIYIPHFASYAFCYLWEMYCRRTGDQLPPVFNRSRWRSLWRGARYSNQKLKVKLGWKQLVTTADGLEIHFRACREEMAHA